MQNNKKKLSWYGTLAQGQGYSGTSERMALQLDKHFDIRVMSYTDYSHDNATEEGKKLRSKPFQMADTGILYGFPNAFTSVMNKNKIGFTMFETDKLPRGGTKNDWAGKSGNPEDNINQMDMLLVPCEHNKKLFRKEGVTIPIEVVHLGVDPTVFQKIIRPKRETFTFLMLATLTIRKNPGMVLGAFLDLFRDRPDVRLVLKTQSGTLAAIETPFDNVKIIDEHSTVEQIKWYYKSADAFVFPTRGEGFGLPPMEAMATGLPTILANHTGMAEFANEKYNYPLNKISKAKATRFPKRWGDVGNWYEPDFEELKSQMKYIEANREESYKKGLAGADWIKENFTFAQTAERIAQIVHDLEDSKKIDK